jgi:hypothetical protein
MTCLVAAPILVPDVLGVTSGTAHAADYESLMREGISLRRSGDDAAALARFQQAYGLEQTPRAEAQIGLAEQALGRWTAADKHLQEALGSASDPWIHKNRDSIVEARAVIATHLGQIEIGGVPVGAEVRVDGELIGRLPLSRPITVTAGGVAVEVRAPGYVPIVRATTVTPRTLTRETFTLQPLSPVAEPRPASRLPASASSNAGTAAAPAPADSIASPVAGSNESSASSSDSPGPGEAPEAPAEGSGGRGGRSHLAIAAGALGVASLAFGIVEHLSWQNKVDSFGSNSGCGTTFPGYGAAGCKQLHDDGQQARLLAFVGYGVAGALVATAIVLYVTDSASAEPAKVACAPALLTSGVSCALRF